MFATDTPYFFVLNKNQPDIDGAKHQLNYDMDFNEEYKIKNKSWEGLNGLITKGKRNREYKKKALHIKFRRNQVF